MKRGLYIPAIFALLATLCACFKSTTTYFPRLHPSATHMAGMRTWHAKIDSYVNSTDYATTFDTSFSLPVIGDSLIRFIGSGSVGQIDAFFNPSESYGNIEVYQANTNVGVLHVTYTYGTDSIQVLFEFNSVGSTYVQKSYQTY